MNENGRTWMLGLMLSVFALPAIAALDPAKPPGQNFDLTHWKLTLPEPGAPEISAATLTAGYTSQWFYTGPDGAMTFWCPVTGGTTSGSTYPRSELREMLNPTSSSSNWTSYGTHILRAVCRVTQVPSSGKIIIGQIHAYNGNPLVKLQWSGGKIENLVKNSPTNSTDTKYTLLTGLALGTTITYEILAQDGVVTVTANNVPSTQNFLASDPLWAGETFYFKAGDYVQDNVGTNTEGGIVSFTSLTTTHSFPGNPPVISLHPQSRTVTSNAAVSIQTIVSGSLPMHFQWRSNKVAIPGANSNLLTLSNFNASKQLAYDLVITNRSGAVTSATANLYLNSPVRFVTHSAGTGGTVVSTLAGLPATSYVVETATNLGSWQPFATNVAPFGLLTVTNSAAPSRRFIRARQN
jgi:hypothetical protein